MIRKAELRAMIEEQSKACQSLGMQLQSVREQRDAFEEQVYNVRFQLEHVNLKYEELLRKTQRRSNWWRRMLGL